MIHRSIDPERAELTSTLLLPTFAMLAVGSLLGSPVSLVEYAVYRAWVHEDTITEDEQNEFEDQLDTTTFPRYQVSPVYPPGVIE